MLLGRMQSSPSCPCPPSFCGWAKIALAGPFAPHACTLLPWAWVSARWARPVGTRVVFPNDLRGCRSRGPGINRNAADSSLASALISTRISLNRSNNSASFPLAPYIKSWPLPLTVSPGPPLSNRGALRGIGSRRDLAHVSPLLGTL